MSLIREIKDYLTFSTSERNGILLLSAILFLVLFYYFLSPLLIKPESIDPKLMRQKMNALIAAYDSSSTQQNGIHPDSIKHFKFDPNNLPEEKWLQLGLTEDQVRVIKNYEKAGGKFYTKQDVKKIYSISEDIYDRLEPWIDLPEKSYQQKTSSQDKKQKPLLIEINSADSSDLTMLYGIGPAFASRIISYRDLLGGYHTKTQLLEVYGMDEERYQGFQENISVDPKKIVKITIMDADFKEILRHPYIPYSLTKFICNQRDSLKNRGLRHLMQFKGMSDSLFQKITPYLSLE